MLPLQYLRHAIPPLVLALPALTSAKARFTPGPGTGSKALLLHERKAREGLSQDGIGLVHADVLVGASARPLSSRGDIATWQLGADTAP